MDAVPAAEDQYVAAGGIHAVFQPVVRLADAAVVGYEALARWPAASSRAQTGESIVATLRRDATGWMDWACRAAAFDGALAGGLSPTTALFVNVEADASHASCPPRFQPTVTRAQRELRTIFEVTERSLATRPAELLRAVEAFRAQGAGIALDDVGADWRSLALMPLIRPDVVKLDMHLIQRPLTAEGTLVAEAVRAYATRSGAQIVAEGIETDAHRQRALALGADLDQGWLYGRPGPLPAVPLSGQELAAQISVNGRAGNGRSPMDVIAGQSALAVATKADLVAISRGFELRALQTTEPCVIVTLFQDAEWFTPATARVYSQLASRSAFVGAFGPGMAREPAPGVRGADLAVNDRLLGEWSVILRMSAL